MKRVLPSHIRDMIDAVRNFAAHSITDITSLLVIDVDPEEADWCLEIIEALVDHCCVTPARAHKRRKQLNQKLVKVGKDPPKTLANWAIRRPQEVPRSNLLGHEMKSEHYHFAAKGLLLSSREMEMRRNLDTIGDLMLEIENREHGGPVYQSH